MFTENRYNIFDHNLVTLWCCLKRYLVNNDIVTNLVKKTRLKPTSRSRQSRNRPGVREINCRLQEFRTGELPIGKWSNFIRGPGNHTHPLRHLRKRDDRQKDERHSWPTTPPSTPTTAGLPYLSGKQNTNSAKPSALLSLWQQTVA